MSDVRPEIQQIREALELASELPLSVPGAHIQGLRRLDALVVPGRRSSPAPALAALARVEATLNAIEAAKREESELKWSARKGRQEAESRAIEAEEALAAAEARVVADEAERDLEKEWGRGQADLLTECATALEAVEGALHDLYVIALNGVVCTPPYTWSDPFLGGDDSGRMFDVEAMKCEECKRAWRKVDAYFSATGASGELEAGDGQRPSSVQPVRSVYVCHCVTGPPAHGRCAACGAPGTGWPFQGEATYITTDSTSGASGAPQDPARPAPAEPPREEEA